MGNPYLLNEAKKPAPKAKQPMKSMVFITALAVLIILMSGVDAAPTTATFENQYGRMTVYPETAEGKEISKSFTQYLNLTSKMGIRRDIDFALVYGSPIVKSRIWLQQTYDNFMPKNASCSNFGCREYNASYCNCTSYKWVEQSLDINHYYNITGDENHYYVLKDIPFSPGQSRYVKWTYQTKESSGKWELLMKPSIMGWLEANSSGYLFSIDPYWNASSTSVVQDTYISGGITGEDQRGFNFGSGDEYSLNRVFIGMSYGPFLQYRKIWGFFRANLTDYILSDASVTSANLTVYTSQYDGAGTACFNITLRRSLCQWDEGSGSDTTTGQASFLHANTSQTGWKNGIEFNDTGAVDSSCISPEIEGEIYVCPNANPELKTWSIRNTTIESIANGSWPNYGFVTKLENFSAEAISYVAMVVSSENATVAYQPRFQFSWSGGTMPECTYIIPTPEDNTILSQNNYAVNITCSKTMSKAFIQFTNASGTINYTMTALNATTFWFNATGQGNFSTSFITHANDTSNYWTKTLSRNVLIDMGSPQPIIYLPTNNSINFGSSIWFNYTSGEPNEDSCWYSIDGNSLVILPECLNKTINLSYFGIHNITLYVNDTAGHIGLTSHDFITISSFWNVTLFNEDYWTVPFDISLPNNVTLFVYCTNGNEYNYIFSKFYRELSINCTVKNMYVRVSYPTDSYTRERLPTTGFNETIPFYLLDAYNRTVIQVPIYIDDYAYFNSIITLYKTSGDAEYIISQGYFDVEHKHITYLAKDSKYTIRITKGSEIREIGFFYATASGVQHLSISSITLRPDISLISNHLRMAAQVNNATNTLVINYFDDLNQTNSVRVRVYEGVNQTAFFDNSYASGTGNLTITILGINASKRYSIQFTISHQSLGNSPIDYVIGAGVFGILVDLGVESWLYPAFAFAIIFFTSMVTIPKNRLAGILFMAVLIGIFFYIGWFNYAIGIAFLLMVFIAIAFVYELKRGDIV